jgi:hypothetical protein
MSFPKPASDRIEVVLLSHHEVEPMLEKLKNEKVAAILKNPELSLADRIGRLGKLRDDARAEQRMASEGGSVDDDGLNSDLRDIELALDRLGETPSEAEGKGPATL